MGSVPLSRSVSNNRKGTGTDTGEDPDTVEQTPWKPASVCLYLSAAFDTVDHQLLLSRLTKSFGVCGTALNWLASYLDYRNQQMGIGTSRSEPTFCISGVPQG